MSRVPYTKPHLTFEQQVQLLIGRGLEVQDRRAAILGLRRIGYYRLSAYWYPFRDVDENGQLIDRFRSGYALDHVLALYDFDKKLRLLVMDAMERVEISVRVEVSHQLGAKDPFAHAKPETLNPEFTKPKNKKANSRSQYDDWRLDEQQHFWRSSERFAEHFASKYLLPMPIWISVELWDFGMLSKFYAGMTVADKAEIAQYYGVPDWKVMESWLRTLNHARNIAAHHGRLWNRNLDDQAKLPKPGAMPRFDHLHRDLVRMTSRVYSVLCILIQFLDRIDPDDGWKTRLRDHIDAFPQMPRIGIEHMGFPKNWRSEEIWQF
jgi:abortive infection bacteriophage resistance protein